MLREFILHYRRRHRTGVYTASVFEHALEAAKNALVEYEHNRGFQVTRFTDEPETKDRAEAS